MTAMSFKNFTGMLPKVPDHLLPDNASTYANNCDFSRTELAALKGGLDVTTGIIGWNPGGNAIRGMYTQDGAFWYTWPTEVVAHRSPVIDEIYHRLYYIEAGTLKVTVTPENSNPLAFGGPPNPALTWFVGVPLPTVAPVLTLIDRTTLADYLNAYIEWEAWWSDGTKNFGRGPITAANLPQNAWRIYEVYPAAKPADVPATAFLVVQATAKEDNKQLFQMNTATGTLPAVSSALPGGITMSLQVDAQEPPHYFVHFEWGVVETRAYVFTEQNTWDEEGGPSPVSLISPTYLQDVQVDMTHPAFTNYRPRKQANIYRTYGGSQYIKAGNAAGTAFVDSARTVPSSTGTALNSLTWVPPVAGMYGLVLAPNGWFAAFRGNTLYMSEPYRPHSWQYSMTFAKTITGICVGAQVIVVTTVDATYVVSGPHPHSATSTLLPIPVGGITHRGMCNVEGGVAFLSNDGIVMVQGSTATLDIGQRYFTREAWRTMFGAGLSSMLLAYHDGYIVGVPFEAPQSGSATGFMLEMDEADGAMTRYDFVHTALMRLPVLDTLYYAGTDNKVYRFREGQPLDAFWNSKVFITPQYIKLGVGFARMSGSGTISVSLYADDQLLHLETLNPTNRTKYFRLPPHRGSLLWQVGVQLHGSCALEDIAFAHTPDELKQV